SVSPIYKDAPLHATSPDVAQQRAIAFENASIGASSLPQSEIPKPEEALAAWMKFSAAAIAHPSMQAWARLRNAPLAMPTFNAMPPQMLPRYSPPTWPTNNFNAYWPVPQASTPSTSHYSPATWSTNAPNGYGPMPLQSSTPTTSGSSTPDLTPRPSYYHPRVFRDATPVSTLTSPVIPQPIAGPSRPYRRVDQVQIHQATTNQRKSNRTERRYDPVAIPDHISGTRTCRAGHITEEEYEVLKREELRRLAEENPWITCRWRIQVLDNDGVVVSVRECMEEVAWHAFSGHLRGVHQCQGGAHQTCLWVNEGKSRTCDKEIKGTSEMRCHILSLKHLGIRPVCPRCSKPFSRMDALKRHLVGPRR
ncbi:hypothetical protein B0H15DRAFT_817948, partial [Mycena belliarum]